MVLEGQNSIVEKIVSLPAQEWKFFFLFTGLMKNSPSDLTYIEYFSHKNICLGQCVIEPGSIVIHTYILGLCTCIWALILRSEIDRLFEMGLMVENGLFQKGICWICFVF